MADELPTMPGDAVVVRGCGKEGILESSNLYQNAYEEWDESGRWALSVFSLPGKTAAEIASDWRYGGDYMRATTVGELRAADFDVIPDPRFEGDSHALLMLPGGMVEEEEDAIPLWDRLKPCFGERIPNPRSPTWRNGGQ